MKLSGIYYTIYNCRLTELSEVLRKAPVTFCVGDTKKNQTISLLRKAGHGHTNTASLIAAQPNRMIMRHNAFMKLI